MHMKTSSAEKCRILQEDFQIEMTQKYQMCCTIIV